MDSRSTSSSYIESRFENDIKTLITRADRLESLVERLLESNLANTELIGEIFKDLKMFMIAKRVQNSTQLHERPVREHSEEGTCINETKTGQTQTVWPSKRLLVNESTLEDVVEPPSKFEKTDLTHQTVQNVSEQQLDAGCIPVEIMEEPEPEDVNYFDNKSPVEEEENFYFEEINDDQQLQQKTFHLPLKTIEELTIFDQELKSSENFQSYMVIKLS